LRFWRGYRLEYPVVSGRLVLSIATGILLLHVIIAGATAARFYKTASVYTVWSSARLVNGRAGPVAPTVTVLSPSQVFRTFGDGLADAALWPYSRDHAMTPGRAWGGFVESLVGLWALFIATFAAAVAPGFLVLGETFRRCRVRFAHLLRGVAYSMSVPGGCIAAAVVVNAFRVPYAGPAAVAVSLGWLGVYWPVFVVRYLRLRHGLPVAMCMLPIGLLTASILVTLVWRYTIGRL
jgi:hypothetical protein